MNVGQLAEVLRKLPEELPVGFEWSADLVTEAQRAISATLLDYTNSECKCVTGPILLLID